MTAAPVVSSKAREEVMDFTIPYYTETSAFLYKHNAQPTLESFLFIRPYKWQVWLCMCVLIPSISLMAWFISHMMQHIHVRSRKSVIVSSFVAIVLNVLGVSFKNGKIFNITYAI